MVEGREREETSDGAKAHPPVGSSEAVRRIVTKHAGVFAR